jgi:hypothetical protein
VLVKLIVKQHIEKKFNLMGYDLGLKLHACFVCICPPFVTIERGRKDNSIFLKQIRIKTTIAESPEDECFFWMRQSYIYYHSQ